MEGQKHPTLNLPFPFHRTPTQATQSTAFIPHIHALFARPTNSAKADTKCEEWDINKMAKKDDAAEAALWNSRMYTAPRLLEDPKVYLGEGGDLVSPDVGS